MIRRKPILEKLYQKLAIIYIFISKVYQCYLIY